MFLFYSFVENILNCLKQFSFFISKKLQEDVYYMLDASPYRYNNIDKIIQSEHVNMRIIFQIIIVYENYHYSYKLFNNGIQWMMKYRQRDDEMSGLLFLFL